MDREANGSGQVTELDVFLKDLEKMITDYKRTFHSNESDISRQNATYDNIIQSKWNSKEFKLIASLSKVVNTSDQARLASNVSLLFTFKRLALNLKILENRIDNLDAQLVKSRVLVKAKTVKSVKKLKEEMVRLKKLETEWQPIIDKLKQAFDNKRKWLADNR